MPFKLKEIIHVIDNHPSYCVISPSKKVPSIVTKLKEVDLNIPLFNIYIPQVSMKIMGSPLNIYSEDLITLVYKILNIH